MLHDREPALHHLGELVAAAADGRGGAVLVTGPLGTGRTALLDAAAAVADGAGLTVLRAVADVLERDFEHGVARQLFEPLLAAAERSSRARLLSAWDGEPPPALAVLPPDPDDPDPSGRHDRVRDLQLLLETVAAAGPVAVLVDDVHWVDDASLDWLAHLAARVTDLGVALVVTVLDGHPGTASPAVRRIAAAAEAVRTRRLPADAVRDVVAERLGRPGDPEFLRACREATGGTPAVLHAVLDGIGAAGGDPVGARAGDVRSARPPAVRERYLQCLRGQDPPARRYLRAVAVLGASADPEALRRLADLDPSEMRSVPDALAAQGLLDETDPVRFAHPLVAEVAADPADREELHHRAAWLLHELGHPVDEVARHLLAVTAPLGGWAIDVLRSAAHETAGADGSMSGTASGGADGSAAGELAVRLLRRALLDSDVTGHERGVLLVELASAERFTEPATAVRHVSQALPLLDDERGRAAALTLIDPALVRDAPAAVRDAVRLADAAPAAGPPGPDARDEGDRATGLRIRARARRMDEQRPAGLAASCDLLREALVAPDQLLDTSAGRELTRVLLHAAALSGRVPAAEVARIGERLLRITPARELSPSPGVPAGDGPRSLLVLALVAAGRPDTVQAWLAAPGGPAGAHGEAGSPEERALVRLAQGRVAEARGIRGGLPRARTAGEPSAFGAALVAAAVETRVPQPGPAPGERSPGGGLVAHATHQMTRGAAAILRGECDLALECFLDCGRHLDHLGWCNPALFGWRSWAARLLRRRGDHAAALAHADEDLALAQAWGAAPALGRALRIRGVLVGGSAGGDQLRAAVELLDDCADRGELGRAEIALGRHLDSLGDPSGEGLVRHGRRRVADAGGSDGPLDPGPSDGTPGPTAGRTVAPAAPGEPVDAARPDVLTDAERQVVDRVVAGATNQMIAQELGVSRRAVEKRLTSAYRKLGVSGRSALTGPA